MFQILDRIEDRIFGAEVRVSPGGWSCNSCTATASDDVLGVRGPTLGGGGDLSCDPGETLEHCALKDRK